MEIAANRLDRLFKQHQEEYEKAALRVLRSGWYILGPEVSAFEEAFAKKLGSKYCVALNSGLDALVLALQALEIGEGDEVLVPSNTYIASVLAITENKATPVFIEPDQYFNIDVSKIEEKITTKTRAILPVHLYGQSCNMDIIVSIAKKHNLFIVEDCAQSHLSTWDGKFTGTFGNVGCFSFFPTKNLGAFGDAGAIITQDKDIYERIRKLRNYGSDKKYYNDLEGVNSRMDEMQAALLHVRLPYLEDFIRERSAIAKRYLSKIQNPKIILPKVQPEATMVWHLFSIQCQDRDELQAYLAKEGIQTQIHYPVPPHLQQCYQYLGYRKGAFPIAEGMANEQLSLPLYNGMTIEENDYIIDKINLF